MRYPARGWRRARATVCISSQAGCAVGCPFCATGELGFWRDLEAAEIVDQVRFWRRRLAGEGRRVTNVVFMGMGEPLLNVSRVLDAAAAITDRSRFGLGARHVTISTSGVLPGIERLIAAGPAYTLAVSLHAARPELRDVLVPLNRRYPIADVVDAAGRYAAATGRRVTYEYVMIEGINDTPTDARAAVNLLRGQLAHVNLIPMNPVAHTPWQPSPASRVDAFAAILRAGGLGTTVRRNRGVDIGAACGQLAADRAGAPSPAAIARGARSCSSVGARPPSAPRVARAATRTACARSRSRRPSPRPTSATSTASCASSSAPASIGCTSTSWTATSCPTSPSGPTCVPPCGA